MKTTLTLEDVERLEETYSLVLSETMNFYREEAAYSIREQLFNLLPLILPVIREYVEGSPKDLRPPAQASLDQGTDAPPAEQQFGSSPQEWLEKYLDTDNTWLLTAYHNDRVVHQTLRHCANLGKPVPFMYQFLAKNLFLAYKEWFDLGMKQAELGPIYSSCGTSAHPGSQAESGESKAQTSQKTAQEGSVCEVEPLGEGQLSELESWIMDLRLEAENVASLGATHGYGSDTYQAADRLLDVFYSHRPEWIPGPTAENDDDHPYAPKIWNADRSSPPSSEDADLLTVVDPGEGWRLLKEGEPLLEGDGFLLPSHPPQWVDYACRPDIFRGNDALGCPVKDYAHTWPWRRKAESSTTSQKGGQGV